MQQLKTFECDDCKSMEVRIDNLESEAIELQNINAEYHDIIQDLQKSKKITLFEDGRYVDNLRACIMELLSHNVGILKIEPVIKSVFTLVGLEYDRFPQRTVINDMIIESRSIAQAQLAELLTDSSQTTLHSDGTSKFGHKYTSYQVSTIEGSYSVGLQVNLINPALYKLLFMLL